MGLSVRGIVEKDAIEILNWRYEAPYDFYNNTYSKEGVSELLNNLYYVVVDENRDIIGFFCTGESAKVPAGNEVGAYDEPFLDIGLGMRPDKTGTGNGTEYFSFILGSIQAQHPTVPIRLTVARFNKRAIHLYKKFGFMESMMFTSNSVLFVTMIKT